MINNLRAEFKRLLKNKISWIFLLVAVAAVLMTTVVYAMMSILMKDINFGNEMLSQMYVISDYKQLFSLTFNSDLIILVVAIMAILYASQPYRSGYVKNICKYIKPGYKMIIPEYICIFTYTVVVAFVSGIVLFGLGGLMFKGFLDTITLRLILKLLGFVACHALLLGTFTCMVTGITNVLRNTALTLVSCLLYSAGFGTMIFQLITLILRRLNLCTKSFELAEYTVIGNVYGVNVDALGDSIIRVCIVCVVVISLSITVSSIMMDKKDIK